MDVSLATVANNSLAKVPGLVRLDINAQRPVDLEAKSVT
jgi:hypothetical protein